MKFNDWTVIEQAGKYWLCRCVCGIVKPVVAYDIKKGKSKGCGCKRIASMASAAKLKNTKHGLSDQTEQRIWSDMKRRCYDPSRKDYHRYGGRGISVCDRWVSGDGENSGFSCFLEDMGRRPSSDHTLDRINNSIGYSKENCRWATREQQNYNTRVTFTFSAFGKTWNLLDASRASGKKASTLYQRIYKYEMSGEEAMLRQV